MEALMTPEEVSDVLGVPTATLAAWRWRGTGPVAIRVGRHVRYRQADVERWIDSQARRTPVRR